MRVILANHKRRNIFSEKLKVLSSPPERCPRQNQFQYQYVQVTRSTVFAFIVSIVQ